MKIAFQDLKLVLKMRKCSILSRKSIPAKHNNKWTNNDKMYQKAQICER